MSSARTKLARYILAFKKKKEKKKKFLFTDLFLKIKIQSSCVPPPIATISKILRLTVALLKHFS